MDGVKGACDDWFWQWGPVMFFPVFSGGIGVSVARGDYIEECVGGDSFEEGDTEGDSVGVWGKLGGDFRVCGEGCCGRVGRVDVGGHFIFLLFLLTSFMGCLGYLVFGLCEFLI